ncbi:MAG: GAF domain-containing protein, partial [Caldilineae bacterium]
FDIDTVIYRTLVYGVLSLALVGLYLMLVALLTRFVSLLNVNPDSPALPIVTVVTVVAIFNPARQFLQLAIDRLFYPHRLVFQQLPLEVSRELSGSVNLDDIIAFLTKTIPQRLQISAAELLLPPDNPPGEWHVYHHTTAASDTLSLPDSLTSYIRQKGHAIALYATENGQETLRPLTERGIEVVVPLQLESRLIGLYNLHAKTSGDYFRPEELVFLSNLGYQAAISISNALSFHQIQQLNRDLEARAREYQALYQQERRRAGQLRLISEVSREVSSILEINRLLDTVVRLIKTSFNYHAVTVILLEDDPSTGEPMLACVASSGAFTEQNSPVGLRIPLRGPGVTARVARTGQPALVRDVRQNGDYIELEMFGNVVSELAVPLLTQDGVIGVLDIVSEQPDEFDDDDLTTLQVLARQIAVAIENAKLYQTQAEQERLKQELLIAHNIQANLLPQQIPQLPGLNLYGLSLPAEEVGGDFFNYVVHQKSQLGVAVGDVSGKGLSGSLFMAVSITALRAEALHHHNISALLESLNSLLYPQLQANRMNAAMLYLHLDMESRLLHVGNAGLVAPMLISGQEAKRSQFLDVGGLPLGVSRRIRYTQKTIPLHKGDLIVACSDGIVEAMNPQREMYGFARLEETLLRAHRKGMPVEELVKTTLRDVQQFMGEAPQHDDMTLVAAEVCS